MYKALLCGCVVDIELTGWNETWTGVDIEYCSKHAAADALLEACIYARDEMVVKTDGEKYAYQELEIAIDLATKERE